MHTQGFSGFGEAIYDRVDGALNDVRRFGNPM
jgi:hypothetical protein